MIDSEEMPGYLDQGIENCNKDDKKSEFDDLEDVPVEQSDCGDGKEESSTRETRTSEYSSNAAFKVRNSQKRFNFDGVLTKRQSFVSQVSDVNTENDQLTISSPEKKCH